MRGQMMDMPLLVSTLIAHDDRTQADEEIVSRPVEGLEEAGAAAVPPTTYPKAHRRARRLARPGGRLGWREGERFAPLAGRGYRHFEIYYGVSGMGAVM